MSLAPFNTILEFTHPKVPVPLFVETGADSIQWSYGMNTQSFPTYGGEVIQILSVFIEDMTISGTTTSYSKLEEIYAWFGKYIQLATQAGEFNETPVAMTYHARGWTFDIIPKSLPSFRYSRDIVAPEWGIQASVSEADNELRSLVIDEAQRYLLAAEDIKDAGDNIKHFLTVSGDIGFDRDNPFSGPKEETSVDDHKKLSDFYNSLIPSYLNGNFDDLLPDTSRPAALGPKITTTKGGNLKKAQKAAGQ